ncbi:MAG: SGNH/GDSL hydrolase family protein [Armatimonadetes bacterium]|nr:SGNH/GDSL hydrolase family protein [Armatimonadota bacterium]
MRACIGMGLMVTVVSGAAASAAPPEFRPVPARLCQQRGGLGNVLAKLKAGKEVRVAYFGGSITAADGWRPKTLKWLQEAYPQAKVSEINAAIGGTGSDLGVFRFRQDVLAHRPDLVFVEFSVNDGGVPPEAIWRAMEGIVRQAWRADPTIDLCYVYTYRVGYEKEREQGLCPPAASADEILAEHYGIPSINVALRTVELAREGKLVYVPPKDAEGKDQPVPEGVTLFSTDGVHPLDAAHEIYAQVVADAVKQMEPTSRPGRHALKAPIMPDNWEKAQLVPLEPAMLSPGWRKLDPAQGLAAAFRHFMPEVWEATKPGEKITFRFRGTAAKLYDIMGPDGCQVVCTVDGKASPPQPRFDVFCSYHRLASMTIAEGLEDAVHTVTVEIHPEQPDRTPVTDRERSNPGFDPKAYDGTVLRVGSLMLIGDLVR